MLSRLSRPKFCPVVNGLSCKPELIKNLVKINQHTGFNFFSTSLGNTLTLPAFFLSTNEIRLKKKKTFYFLFEV